MSCAPCRGYDKGAAGVGNSTTSGSERSEQCLHAVKVGKLEVGFRTGQWTRKGRPAPMTPKSEGSVLIPVSMLTFQVARQTARM